MLEFVRKCLLISVLILCCGAQYVSAGWLEDAAQSATERVGTRAVDEAADATYEAVKGKITGSGDEQEGAQGSSRSTEGQPVRETERHKPAPGMAGEAIDDDHFIQGDDYFISQEPLEKNAWSYVNLAKMVTEPSTRTKGEAEFFLVTDGSKAWTKHFFQTRIAGDGDMKLGTIIIAFEGLLEDGIYQAPTAKDNARGGAWFMAKVTDLSDLYRGYVTVSGNYKISPNNLRVVLPKVPSAKK